MVWWCMPAEPAFSWLLEDFALRQLCHCPSVWVEVLSSTRLTDWVAVR